MGCRGGSSTSTWTHDHPAPLPADTRLHPAPSQNAPSSASCELSLCPFYPPLAPRSATSSTTSADPHPDISPPPRVPIPGSHLHRRLPSIPSLLPVAPYSQPTPHIFRAPYDPHSLLLLKTHFSEILLLLQMGVSSFSLPAQVLGTPPLTELHPEGPLPETMMSGTFHMDEGAGDAATQTRAGTVQGSVGISVLIYNKSCLASRDPSPPTPASASRARRYSPEGR